MPIRMAEITDGASHTFLAGEKYVNVDYYRTLGDPGYNQYWDIGFDYDSTRWTNSDASGGPWQDMPGQTNAAIFGSAHAANLNMAFCDGSVESINYSIDHETYRRLGNRNDGLAIDAKKF